MRDRVCLCWTDTRSVRGKNCAGLTRARLGVKRISTGRTRRLAIASEAGHYNPWYLLGSIASSNTSAFYMSIGLQRLPGPLAVAVRNERRR